MIIGAQEAFLLTLFNSIMTAYFITWKKVNFSPKCSYKSLKNDLSTKDVLKIVLKLCNIFIHIHYGEKKRFSLVGRGISKLL